MRHYLTFVISTACLFSALILPQPTYALTAKECSAKYKAAQAAGTLNGMKWNDFRKAECGSNASPVSTSTGASTPSGSSTTTRGPATATTKPNTTSTDAVFPTAVSAKYSKEKAGTARMHTCLDQYKANKASNANGGLRWIEKGGGYYSECNKRLKT